MRPRAAHCPSLKVPVTVLTTAVMFAQILRAEGVAWGGGKFPRTVCDGADGETEVSRWEWGQPVGLLLV